uniref:Uncharacterized protein n=1 Tax=Cacopsylla melanoneura TaxID=428564 RepID=A0A8D8THN1_9HEMI
MFKTHPCEGSVYTDYGGPGQGYSYTRNKYFNPNTSLKTSLAQNRITVSAGPRYSLDFSYPNNVGHYYDYARHDEDSVTSKINKLLQQYENTPYKPNNINKTVHFDDKQTGFQPNENKYLMKPLNATKKQTDHVQNILNALKRGSHKDYMDEISTCKSNSMTKTWIPCRDTDISLSSTACRQPYDQTGATSYDRIGLFQSVLNNMHTLSTMENKSVQCEKVSKRNNNHTTNKDKNITGSTEEVCTDNKNKGKQNVCDTNKTAINILSSESEKTNHSTDCKFLQKTLPTKHSKTCGKNSTQLWNPNLSKKSSKNSFSLICDPQCQKLKTQLRRIHKGLEFNEPYYKFCGKVHNRSRMTHPILDRKSRSCSVKPKTAAVMKTIDNTKISIKANMLVINCNKENYQNILSKIENIEILDKCINLQN